MNKTLKTMALVCTLISLGNGAPIAAMMSSTSSKDHKVFSKGFGQSVKTSPDRRQLIKRPKLIVQDMQRPPVRNTVARYTASPSALKSKVMLSLPASSSVTPVEEELQSPAANTLLSILAMKKGAPQLFGWGKLLAELALMGAAGYWTSKDFLEYYRKKAAPEQQLQEFEGETVRAQCLAPIEQCWYPLARTGTIPPSEGAWYYPLQRRTGQLVDEVVEHYGALPPVEQGPWNLMLERSEGHGPSNPTDCARYST